MIFKKPSKQRLRAWYDFRQQLETSCNPLDDVATLYSHAPAVKIYSDPYDQTTWPTPWELLEENEYCPFNQTLAVAYSLKLTSRFKDWQPKIAITIDNDNKCVYYLLYHLDKVYGFEKDKWISIKTLPVSLTVKKIYYLDSLH